MIKPLSKSEIKELNEKIKKQFSVDNFFDKKDKIVLLKEEDSKSILKDKKENFFYLDDILVPNLKLIIQRNFLKKIIVDLGAIKFVTNGADVMRPGIKEIGEGIKKNDVILVMDEKYHKPLAVCKALYDTEDMLAKNEGKVLQNLHHVGDKRWRNTKH